MKSSQWYRNNYGFIIIFGIIMAATIKAHVDLIDPGMVTENVQQEANKEAENNGETYSDSNGKHHNV